MFSRMSANRFEKERPNPIGPGYYRIPAAFDDGAMTDGSQGGWRETSRAPYEDGESSVGSFQVFEDAQERGLARTQVAPRTPKRRPLSVSKENRIPTASNNKGGGQDILEVEQLRKRLLNMEAQADDAAAAKRSAARAHAVSQAKDHEIEDLRRKNEDLIAFQAQAQKRIGELENEKRLHGQALSDRDGTIQSLQRSLQLSKKDKPEAASPQPKAQRLTEKDSALEERARELEEAHQYLDCLQQRFVSHFEATEARLKELTKSQERIHTSVLERDAQAGKRARELERVLRDRRCHEAQVVSQLAVREAEFKESLGLLAEEQRARQEAEASVARLASEVETLRSRPAPTSPCKADEQKQESPAKLSVEYAEMRGRLFEAEQVQRLGEDRRRQLEEALAAKDAEVSRLTEAVDELRRSLEETQSAKLEVEACNEVQSAELEALRLEVRELRSREADHEAEREGQSEDEVLGLAEEDVEVAEAEAADASDEESEASVEDEEEAEEAEEQENRKAGDKEPVPAGKAAGVEEAEAAQEDRLRGEDKEKERKDEDAEEKVKEKEKEVDEEVERALVEESEDAAHNQKVSVGEAGMEGKATVEEREEEEEEEEEEERKEAEDDREAQEQVEDAAEAELDEAEVSDCEPSSCASLPVTEEVDDSRDLAAVEAQLETSPRTIAAFLVTRAVQVAAHRSP